jgi:unsaturated rhamnogalacturonyl hydrolase
MKQTARLLCAFIVAFSPTVVLRAGETAQRATITATPLEWSARLADAEMKRRGDSWVYKPGGRAHWAYDVSLFCLSLIELSDQTGDPRFEQFAEKVTGSFIQPDGNIRVYKFDDLSIDNVRPASTVLTLYSRTREERYRKAADLVHAQMQQMPRTASGGIWHKLRYPDQLWLDGLFMGQPFAAQYAQMFGEPWVFDDMVRQFTLVGGHTYDAKTGLFYHAWDESKKMPWANKETGASPSFWGRAVGWYAMAFVDALEFFPKDHPGRAQMLAWFRKLADGLVKNQDASGLWWQVLDQGNREGNYREATASSMFVYAMAKAVNNGWLPREFTPVIRKGYEGIIRDLVKTDRDGLVNLTQCCRVAGLDAGMRDGSFNYYTIREPIVSNDPKGTGPFVRAGIEVQKLLGADVKFTGGSPLPTGWKQLPQILSRIVPPTFPKRLVSITDCGAVGDGKTDCTEAIRKAIRACSEAGGGHVTVLKGTYLTGPITLLSNVNLHVDEGATLLFKTDPAAYLPAVATRYEGIECMNYSPFIYAIGQVNIAITGKGTLDGQAAEDNWWSWVRKKNGQPALAAADRKQLVDYGESDTPVAKRVFGAGHFLRPSFIEPYRCKNVVIEGVTILRSPMWEIHPVLCNNVTVRGVNISSHGPNNDGCDPESCRDVLIEGCTFDTGDDCIAIKSGRNGDGRRVGVASENIIIRDCTMRDGHGGVTIGSEISGDCRNVFVENCEMDSPNLDRALRIKTNAMRGGVVEGVFMQNVEVGHLADAVLWIDFNYEEGANGPFMPVVRNICLENVTSRQSKRALMLRGFEQAPIRNVRLVKCKFDGVKSDDIIEHVEGLEQTKVTITRVEKKSGEQAKTPAQ